MSREVRILTENSLIIISSYHNVENKFKSSEEFTGEFFMKVWDELDKKYRGRYVLLKEDKVVAFVDSLKEAYEVLKDKDLGRCVIYKAGEKVEEGEWGWSSIEP